MTFVIAQNYLCFFALIEMVVKDASENDISQEELCEEFGVVVPHNYKTELRNIRYSSNENDYGVHVTDQIIQKYFDDKKIDLHVKYIDSTYINEINFGDVLIDNLNKKRYIIMTYSYGVLYNMNDKYNIGHVALLEKVIDEDRALIYDPGPDGAGEKVIGIMQMHYAMRRKGGIYIIS